MDPHPHPKRLLSPSVIAYRAGESAAAANAASAGKAPSAATVAKRQRAERVFEEFAQNGAPITWKQAKEKIGTELGTVTKDQWKSAITEANQMWKEAATGGTDGLAAFAVGDIPELDWSERIDTALTRIYGTSAPPQDPLPPKFETWAASTNHCHSPSSLQWRAVKRTFVESLFPGDAAAFDPADANAWKKFCHRYMYVQRRFNGGEGPARIRRMRHEKYLEYGYARDHSNEDALKDTSAEALFCDKFDTLAARWESGQRALAERPLTRCDVCHELKPIWMTTVHLVHGGDDLPKELSVTTKLEKNALTAEQASKWNAYVANKCVGKRLCSRCRAPEDAEKQAGMHRFSEENGALLRRKPPRFPLEQLTAQLAGDPFAVFSIATEAEVALVRLTIPWCAAHCSCVGKGKGGGGLLPAPPPRADHV